MKQRFARSRGVQVVQSIEATLPHECLGRPSGVCRRSTFSGPLRIVRPMNSATANRVSAVVGFCAVALGAFGAHGLKELLERFQTTDVWQTAALYHLVHSVVLLFVESREPLPKAAFWLF